MDFVRALRTFVRVVDTGSFAHAAAQLETSGAAVSRQIAALEKHVQARLLNRTTRTLSLTPSGEAFAAKARSLLQAIEDAENFASPEPQGISGMLRLTAPLSFGIARLGPLLSGFRQRYPQLRLDIDLSDRQLDLAAHGFDLALRIAREPSSHLVARRIAPVHLVLCAAPEYLRARGNPAHPRELAQHETLSYSFLSCGETWPFTHVDGEAVQVRISPSVSATNGEVLRDLAVAGGGIILQPAFIVEGEIARGTLQPLLPAWKPPEFHLYAVYLTQRQLSRRIRLFVDYLVDCMGGEEGGRGDA